MPIPISVGTSQNPLLKQTKTRTDFPRFSSFHAEYRI